MKKIKLRQNKYALVDDEDFNYLNQWRWHIAWNGYVVRGEYNGGNYKNFFLHRVIIKTPKGMFTDHINHNRLDNRKSNLRICTKSQNGFNRNKQKNNTSGYKGVTFEKQTKKWVARIRFNGQMKTIGRFFNPEEASEAYKQVALKLCGEFICV